MRPHIAIRIKRGVMAQVFQRAVNVLLRLFAVPAFLFAWGVDMFGEWLILTALAQQIATSNLGFNSAAAVDLAVKGGEKNRQGSLDTFQSLLAFLLLLTTILLLLLPALVFGLPLGSWMNISAIGADETIVVLFCVCLYVVLQMYFGAFLAIVAAEGHYGFATFVDAIFFALVTGLPPVIALAGGAPHQAALSMVAVGAVQVFTGWVIARRFAPWLEFGVRHARRSTVRRLFLPAGGFLMLNLALLLSVQGPRIIIGVLIGPAATATFVTIATIPRLMQQITTIVNHIIRPELSIAAGRRDLALCRQLHHRGCQISFWLVMVSALLLALTGDWILAIWTGDRIQMHHGLYYTMLAAMVVASLWMTSHSVLMSMNRHVATSSVAVAAMAAGLGVGALALVPLGLAGMAGGLLLAELFMLALVLPRSLRQLQSGPSELLSTMARPPVAWLLRHARFPARSDP